MAIQQMFLGIGSVELAEPDGSVYFDGIDDRLTFAATSDFAFDNDDFTIEAFVNRVGDNKLYSRILHFGPYWNNDDAVGLNFDDNDHATKVTFGNYKNRSQGTVPSNGRVLISNSSVSSVGWYHVAVTRHQGTFRLFINGILEDTNSSITNNHLENSSTNTLAIAGTVDLMGQEPFNANISNVRVIKGTALYTDSFVPPSSALTDEHNNTKLLCCQSDTDITAKAVGGTINVDGNPQISSKNPFPFTTSYAVDFDGNGDYLSIPASSDLNLDAAFTIEAWVNVDDGGWSGTRRTLIANDIGWATNHFAVSLMNSGNSNEENCITLWDYNANNNGPVASSSPVKVEPSDGWTHIAITRDSSNNIRIFKNGTQAGSTITSSSTYQFGTGATWIGAITMSNTANAEQLDGKISNLRVVKGQALYTSDFTTSTGEFTTTSQGATASNVKLLCCNKITRTGSTVTPGSITEVGDPKSTNGPFPVLYNYSVDFDGTLDYLSIPDNDAWYIETNYTAECWFNCDALTGAGWDAIFAQWQSNGGNATNSWCLEYVGTDLRFYWMDGNGSVNNISLGAVSLGAWHHFAFSKSGSTTRMFIDGNEAITAFDIGTIQNGTGIFAIGGAVAINAGGSGTGGYFNGKISNVRITKGQALYTSAFTPSTEPLTTSSQGAIASNVKLLCCNSFNTVTGSITTPGTITAVDDPSIALGPF